MLLSKSTTLTAQSEDTDGKQTEKSTKTTVSHVRYISPHCIAFGAGLKWGQVGKVAEFVVKAKKVQKEGNNISVSIECFPYDFYVPFTRPFLQIKPTSENTYIVRFTPTRPGEYFINVLCNHQSVSGSPFRLHIKDTVVNFKNGLSSKNLTPRTVLHPEKQALTEELLLKSMESVSASEYSAFVDDDSIRTPILSQKHAFDWLEDELQELYHNICSDNLLISAEETVMKICGDGLHHGVVGEISSFRVITPNLTNGPLEVNITCPAMSLPVPEVKRKCENHTYIHQVLYIPTEPGIYEVTVKWGVQELPGSPFSFAVTEGSAQENIPIKSNTPEALTRYLTNTDKHTIYVYHCATTTSSQQKQQKEELMNLLRKSFPLDKLIPVAVDIEYTSTEREELYKFTNTRVLPVICRDQIYIGAYNDIMKAVRNGKLNETISYASQ